MLKSNDKKLVVYKDDFKPINVYGNGVKLAGYKEENFSGTTIEADATYNDTLDCKVIGHHEQESHKAYWWNQQVPNLDEFTTIPKPKHKF